MCRQKRTKYSKSVLRKLQYTEPDVLYDIKIYLQYSRVQFASLVSVVTMVVGGAGILANCLNIFVLSRYRGGAFYKVHFIRLEVNMSICQKIGSHLIS